jgi:hypothetical protein
MGEMWFVLHNQKITGTERANACQHGKCDRRAGQKCVPVSLSALAINV